MKNVILLILIFTIIISCAVPDSNAGQEQEYVYQMPVEKNDGLRVSDLEAQNLDESTLTKTSV